MYKIVLVVIGKIQRDSKENVFCFDKLCSKWLRDSKNEERDYKYYYYAPLLLPLTIKTMCSCYLIISKTYALEQFL